MDLPFYREYDLPWTTDAGQENKFQRLLGTIFLVVLVLGVVWPFIPVPEPDPNEIEEIPPRIAQLLLEEKPLPPPPPPKVEEPEPEPEDEPEPEPAPATESEPTTAAAAEATAAPAAESEPTTAAAAESEPTQLTIGL